jgi:hypothetical protein
MTSRWFEEPDRDARERARFIRAMDSLGLGVLEVIAIATEEPGRTTVIVDFPPQVRTPMRLVGQDPSLYDLRQAWLDAGDLDALAAFLDALAAVKTPAALDVLDGRRRRACARPANPVLGSAWLLAAAVMCVWLHGTAAGAVLGVVAAGLAVLAFRPVPRRDGSVEIPGEREERYDNRV